MQWCENCLSWHKPKRIKCKRISKDKQIQLAIQKVIYKQIMNIIKGKWA